MPVLHFFTGTHGEYHKPDDDANLINYDGMEKVFEYITMVIDALSDDGKIAFTKTQDNEGRSTPRFTVTLGVVPDYMYEKGGLKIDGVNDNKPGALAGIQKGDIITRIGEWEIDDIYAYMDVLSKLKKGDKTDLEVVRGEETLTLEIQF
jgi:S1-C subfamily serine protease